jgi:starch-binding outer membrane protein, SusD/RagB family
MNQIMMKRTVALIAGLTLFGACVDSTGVPDLNNVSSSLLQSGLNSASVQLLMTGLLRADRANLDVRYLVFTETSGRDLYRIDAAENRWITELIGGPADPTSFVGGGIWTQYYTEIRAANNLIDNIKTATDLSAAQQAGVTGLARTIKALAYYRLIESRDSLGIPIDVDHALSTAPAPFVCKPNALAYVSALLDSGYADLQTAGSTPFSFVLPGGFTTKGDYSTPANFISFNRGLKGKVEYYRGMDHSKPNAASFATALTALNLAIGAETGATLENSVYYIYSTAPGEVTNPLNDAAIHLNPSAGDSIQPGDLRSSKITLRAAVASGQGVSTKYDLTEAIPSIGSNLTKPIPILKRSEMVLLRAQVNIETGNLAAATTDINLVRTTLGGLPALPTLTTVAAARSAVLYEKRYTLLGETGARWVDLRAYGRFNAQWLKQEIAIDIFQAALPIPQAELNPRGGGLPTLSCS